MIFVKEELEETANEINKSFFPQRLKQAIALDPYDLLEKLGCTYDWKYITPDKSILGITFFEDGAWFIWPSGEYKKGDLYKKEFFTKNTILINQAVLDEKNRYEENFIVAHEASHIIKDRAYFTRKADNFIQVCKKNDMRNTSWYNGLSELEIIERQTNYLGAAILMPKEIIKNEFFKLLRYKNIPDSPIDFKPFMRSAVGELSKKFQVNFNPVKYRLMEIGVLARN